MLDIENAQRHVDNVMGYCAGSAGMDSCIELRMFIAEVERLVKHNKIKQVPALFKPPAKVQV